MEEFSVNKLFKSIHRGDKFKSALESYQQVPLPLVIVNEEGMIEVCSEGIEMLRLVVGNIGVVAIGGTVHSGKSLLANLLIHNKGSGFEVNHDLGNTTKGIWIWGEPIQTKNNSILFLDCQGLPPANEYNTIDAKILALSLVLSSVFIYNSKGVIDEFAVSQLALATSFKEMIDFSSNLISTIDETSEIPFTDAPDLIWTVRDFSVAVVDDNGNTLTSKNYMEQLLNMSSFMGKNGKKNSEYSEMVRSTFPNRDCVTLPRPVDKEKDLENLDQFRLEDLRYKFRNFFEKFKFNLLEFCPNKRIDKMEVTGGQLGILLKQLVLCMNEGEVPDFYYCWDFSIRIEYEEALCKAKEKYLESKQIDPALMPYDEKELLECLQSAKDFGLCVFSEIPNKNPELIIEVTEAFYEFFNEDLKYILKSNMAASEAFNLSLLESIYRPIIQKLDEGLYVGRFEEMESEWTRAMRQYEKQAKGPGKFIAISEFSRLHQHSAFERFFQDILDRYKNELDFLREKHNEYEEMMNRQLENESRQKIIDEHVREN